MIKLEVRLQRLQIVQLYYENGRSVKSVYRALRPIYGVHTQREIPGYSNLMNTVKFVFDHIFRSELSLEELYWCTIFLVTGTRIINHSDL